MTLQKELMDIGKERLTQMKVLVDELQVQLSLGKAEAKDAFERERKNFLRFINEEKAQLRRSGETAEKHREMLLDKFEALEAQLSKEIAASKRQFDVQKKNALHTIYELEFALKETYGDVSMTVQTKLDNFKGKLDGYRIQLALGEYEAEDKMRNRRKELKEAIGDIRTRLQKEVGAGEKIDKFGDEISTSFEHMKKAFSELFS